MDKSWTESSEKIYYYRLVATSIQRTRKNAGLHPWDEINVMFEGNPKYSLDSQDAITYIENITRIKLLNYSQCITESNFKLVYSDEFENIGITIHLIK